jgi:hypothetical protein
MVRAATIDKIWVRLFIESDPLNREIKGPGLKILRSLGWGAMAGLIGGLLSMPAGHDCHWRPAESRGHRLHSHVGFRGVSTHLSVSAPSA